MCPTQVMKENGLIDGWNVLILSFVIKVTHSVNLDIYSLFLIKNILFLNVTIPHSTKPSVNSFVGENRHNAGLFLLYWVNRLH